MPFINDRLEANREQIAEARDKDRPPRRSRFLFDPESVALSLRSRIIGQDSVIDALEDMLYAVKADIGEGQRPLAVNLLLGPTGSGKTETVRLIAEAIHGSADKLCRIDMNTLAQEHYSAAITGAPPGYVGSREGQTLFDIDAIKGSFSKPGIVLFDELEKASTEVIRALLNVLDTGRLMLAAGNREIDFRNTLVFMTSNIGAREVADYRQRFASGWRKILQLKPVEESAFIDRALHRQFDAEFINRIDRILPFHRLGKRWLPQLLQIEIDDLQSRLDRYEVTLELDQLLKSHLCRQFDERFGARDIARRIRTELEPAIARVLLKNPEHKEFCGTVANQIIQIRPR